jgi:acyl-homoserine lactone acylase PvdQ
LVIGRGPDYAWSLTSAGSDVIDTFAETLCGGSRAKYRYNGRCRTMGKVDAGTLKGAGRIVFRTTVHGPVTGYAKVGGRTVALARKRAGYGQDAVWQTMFRDLTTNKVHSPASFIDSVQDSPYTFNIAYADDRNIAMFSAGKLPNRDPRVDPRLPTKGTGRYEWRGFLSAKKHPQAVNPSGGMLVNWNNRPAKGFGAADDNWTYGSSQRVQMLLGGLAARPQHDLASVTSAMNAAATQDLRSVELTPLLQKLLATVPAPSPRSQRMLEKLETWRANGSSRLDRDLDGFMDSGGAPVIWDTVYPLLFKAAMGGVLKGPLLEQLRTLVGTEGGAAGHFTDGGFWYLDKDLKRLTGAGLKRPFETKYCGGGDSKKCATALWGAFEAAGAALQAVQGTPDPDAWRSDANQERIKFAPGLLPTTIRFTNRPSGIQQVVSFSGHR